MLRTLKILIEYWESEAEIVGILPEMKNRTKKLKKKERREPMSKSSGGNLTSFPQLH